MGGPIPAVASCHIRGWQRDDLPALAALEARAARLFGDHGHAAIANAPQHTPDELADFIDGNQAWVAVIDAEPAGFAVAGQVGAAFYLKELSVDPGYGRRGVGTALLEFYVGQARRSGYRLAALSTFRDIPFNAPFYSRRGFSVLPPETAPDALKKQFLAEVPSGIDPASRVLMVRRL